MSLKIDIDQIHSKNDNFASQLIRLMQKADRRSYEKLARAFPNTAKVYEAWIQGNEIPDLQYD